MGLLKTALKANNVAVAAAGDSDGNAFIRHIWETNTETLLESTEIRDTAVYYSSSIDISEWGTFSLRVANSLKDSEGNNISCRARLQFDGYNTSYNTKAASGQDYVIELPFGYTFITPDDYPLFNYLSEITLKVAANATPSSGTIAIKIVKKR